MAVIFGMRHEKSVARAIWQDCRFVKHIGQTAEGIE
jgi:hypothetical protein